MSDQTKLFQILYQNEILFHLPEDKRVTAIKNTNTLAENKSVEPVAEPIRQTLAEPIQNVKNTTVFQEFPSLNHQILILTENEKQPQLPESEALLLDNILKAVKFSIHEADIFNFSLLPPTDARSILAQKKIGHFITFGVPLIKLNVDLLLIPYVPKLVKGIWFLMADPLSTIESDRELKKKLWQALKQMFE